MGKGAGEVGEQDWPSLALKRAGRAQRPRNPGSLCEPEKTGNGSFPRVFGKERRLGISAWGTPRRAPQLQS